MIKRGILIVDDSESDIELLKGLFSSKDPNVVVHTALTGKEVQGYIKSDDGHSSMPGIDLVIVDFNMPTNDGVNTLKKLKSDPELHNIPVIVFSGSESEADIATAYGLGANSYLVKPVQYEQLSKIVALIDSFWLKSVCLAPHP